MPNIATGTAIFSFTIKEEGQYTHEYSLET